MDGKHGSCDRFAIKMTATQKKTEDGAAGTLRERATIESKTEGSRSVHLLFDERCHTLLALVRHLEHEIPRQNSVRNYF